MIEVVSVRASDAVLTDDCVRRGGRVVIDGPPEWSNQGQADFGLICSSMMVQWMSAELVGDFSHDSARVRLTDGTSFFYIDEDDGMAVKPVTDSSQWDSEWSAPDLLSSIDLWTKRDLGVVVRLVRTSYHRSPSLIELRVLMRFPTWIGSAHHAIQSIVDQVSVTAVLAVEEETLTADQSEWRIGEPWSEFNIVPSSLEQVTVNGVHKSASLDSGVITLLGPPARAGDTVVLAFKYAPNTSVRRGEHVSTIDVAPAWWCQELVVAGGQSGLAPRVVVGCYSVSVRRLELRVTVNGVASRVKDAIQMRAALQQSFADGLNIDMPSGRRVSAHLDGVVEVVVKQGSNLPMATGIVQCSMIEYVTATLIRPPRTGSPQVPLRTTIETQLPDGVVVLSDDPVPEIC